MPRKAKEKIDENNVIDEVKEKKSSVKKVAKAAKTAKTTKSAKDSTDAKKKTTTKKAVSTEKKTTAKKATSTEKKTTAKKATSTEKKTTAKKATSTTKKTATKKTASAEKKTSAKKSTSTSKKTTTRKKATSTKTKASTKKAEDNLTKDIQILEYYDLPYKYGNTIVKLLAQTPKTLFVYWEISDEDINNFKQQYGEDFFNITKPILIVHNLTLNKTSEVEINDFANCWYLNTDDADCKFDIELARKFIKTSDTKKSNADEYLSVAKSNDLQAPNDHIMFENLTNVVTFKNYSTNQTIEENVESFKFLKDIYKFYQNMYNDELLKNPSSKF